MVARYSLYPTMSLTRPVSAIPALDLPLADARALMRAVNELHDVAWDFAERAGLSTDEIYERLSPAYRAIEHAFGKTPVEGGRAPRDA